MNQIKFIKQTDSFCPVFRRCVWRVCVCWVCFSGSEALSSALMRIWRVRPLGRVLLGFGPVRAAWLSLFCVHCFYCVFSRRLEAGVRGHAVLCLSCLRVREVFHRFGAVRKSRLPLCPETDIFTGFLQHKAALLVPRSAIDYIIPGREKLLRGARRRSLCVWLWQLSRRRWIRRGRFCSPALSSPTMADSAPSKLFLRPHYAALPRRTAPPLPPAFGRSGPLTADRQL